MTESSSDRTKRNIIKYLSDDYYKVQQSIFFKEYEPEYILESFAKIREHIKRNINEETFWLVRAKYANKHVFEDQIVESPNLYLVTIYIQFYTNSKCNYELLEKKIKSLIGIRCKIKSRSFSEERKASWLSALKSQSLNDLSFANKTDKVIRRWSVTMKGKR